MKVANIFFIILIYYYKSEFGDAEKMLLNYERNYLFKRDHHWKEWLKDGRKRIGQTLTILRFAIFIIIIYTSSKLKNLNFLYCLF